MATGPSFGVTVTKYAISSDGNYAAAEPLYQKALAIHQKLLGEDHPLTALSYSNVAVNLNRCPRDTSPAAPCHSRHTRRPAVPDTHADCATRWCGHSASSDRVRPWAASRMSFASATSCAVAGFCESCVIVTIRCPGRRKYLNRRSAPFAQPPNGPSGRSTLTSTASCRAT